MKSWFAKFRGLNDALDSALCRAMPKAQIPVTLHDSIMRAVEQVALQPASARRSASSQAFHIMVLRRFRTFQVGWFPVSGFAALMLLSLGLFLHYRRSQPGLNTESLPEISTTLTASQEIVDALPAATVGPLSQELDNVNQDLDRTAEFILAALP